MCFCQLTNTDVEQSTSSGCMSKPTPQKNYAPQEQGLKYERFMKYWVLVSNMFYFHPKTLGKMNPFWLIFFQMGWLVQPPPRVSILHFLDFHVFVTLSTIFRKSVGYVNKEGWLVRLYMFYLPSRLRNPVIHQPCGSKRPQKETRSYYNHPFSGGELAVRFRGWLSYDIVLTLR